MAWTNTVAVTDNITSITLAGCTAGNIIIGGYVDDNPGTVWAAPTCPGETFNLRGSTATTAWGGTNISLQLFDCIVASSGSKTITVSATGGDTPQIWAAEYTPAATFDNSNTALNAAGANPTVNVVAAGSGELAVGIVCCTVDGPTAGAGFTLANIGDPFMNQATEYNGNAGPSPVTVNFTATSTQKWIVLAGLWKPFSGGGGPSVVLMGQAWM